MPPLFGELGACVELGITYEQWLAQPAQHRAYFVEYLGVKARMESVEHQEMRQRSAARR